MQFIRSNGRGGRTLVDERLTIGDKEMKKKVTRIKRILFLKKLGQRHFEGQINEPTPNSKEIVLDPKLLVDSALHDSHPMHYEMSGEKIMLRGAL